jgi:hypothetical protein
MFIGIFSIQQPRIQQVRKGQTHEIQNKKDYKPPAERRHAF